MRSMDTIKTELWRTAGRTALWLLLLPALTLAFCLFASHRWDAQIVASISQEIQARGTVDNNAQGMLALLSVQPPSATCTLTGADTLSEIFCEPFGAQWQFYIAKRVSQFTLAGGLLLLLAIAALGRMAFHGRAAQFRSIVLAWRLLAISSAIEVVLQGAMLVWLSFWLSAYFLEIYVIKLIVLAAILAVGGAFTAITEMFAHIPSDLHLDGETISEADAPALWARIRALAGQIGTAPPDHIIGGIDANFFVTEAAIEVQQQHLEGRSLYVSLPLLRVLDRHEADAVLAHELSHLHGGDTSNSAALGPKLAQFDTYCRAMGESFLTWIAFYSLSLYRTIVEIALKRDSRTREFLADRTAADTVSAKAIVTSLIKVAAYSSYRDKIEQELFARATAHSAQIGISTFVAEGLAPFSSSAEFVSIMATASTPHPFDSHPQLEERMDNVDTRIAPAEFGAVLATPLADSWVDDITTAPAIETRLWEAYEARFAQHHEHTLAYRYRPAGEEETALVLKYFPGELFALGDKTSLTIAYDGLTTPKGDLVSWDEIEDMTYEAGYLSDTLILVLDKGDASARSRKIKLPDLGAHKERFKAELGRYFQRHRASRESA
ncbi:MAG: M48 family metallopeptidase [Massilia sp.]